MQMDGLWSLKPSLCARVPHVHAPVLLGRSGLSALWLRGQSCVCLWADTRRPQPAIP